MVRRSYEVYLILEKLDSAFLLKMVNALNHHMNVNMLMVREN